MLLQCRLLQGDHQHAVLLIAVDADFFTSSPVRAPAPTGNAVAIDRDRTTILGIRDASWQSPTVQTPRQEDGAAITACRGLDENSNEDVALQVDDGGFIVVTGVAKAQFSQKWRCKAVKKKHQRIRGNDVHALSSFRVRFTSKVPDPGVAERNWEPIRFIGNMPLPTSTPLARGLEKDGTGGRA